MSADVGLDIDALPADVQLKLAGILDNYLSSLERGEVFAHDSAEVKAFLHEHPEIAEPLHKHMESLRMLMRVTTPPASSSTPSDHDPPQELGDFMLLKEIGRGGMGVVYEAQQRSLGRRVALKVLPFAAVLEPKQITRFQHEAQAAAQLHHPHIVPVYGVGCERGVHYYSMQLVEGRSLEKAIRDLRERESGNVDDATVAWTRNASQPSTSANAQQAIQSPGAAYLSTLKNGAGVPTLRDRNYYRHTAELMVQAADALHYAHENGIVHRDIKPSNLLLDNAGKLWITDFGLARMATDANLTVTGDILGTIRYMSPEQAAGQNHLIDHRTDIYALGITLYELLTLRPLHDGLDRPSILRHIESSETPRPRKWNRDIPHDLETILLKSLSHERDQRYHTAQEMANDLRNFLAGRALLARRPGPIDRLTSWALRHRRAMAISAVLFALSFVAIAVVAFMLMSANQRTQEALSKSNSNYHQAREIVKRFLTQQARRLGEFPGTEPLQKELLQDTLDYYQDFIQQAMDDPPLRGELAEAYFFAGEAAEKLGDKTGALASYEQAITLLTKLLNEQENPELRGKLANTLNNMGLLQWEQGQKLLSESSLREAVRHYEACAFALTKQPRYRDRWTTALANLALIKAQQGQHAEAGTLYQTALSIQEQLIAENPREIDFRRGLAVMLNNVSHWRRKMDPPAAIEFCLQSLLTQQEMARLAPHDDNIRFDLSLTFNNLGSLRGDQREYEAAAAAHLEALAIQEQLMRKRAGIVRYRRDVAISYNNLGHIRNLQQQPDAAIQAYRESRKQLQQLTEDFPNDATYRSVLAGVWNNEGLALEKAHDLSAALSAFQEAVKLQRDVIAGVDDWSLPIEALNQHYRHLIRVAALQNDEQAADQAIKDWKIVLKRKSLSGKPLLSPASDLAAEVGNATEEAERRALANQAIKLVEIAMELQGVARKDLEDLPEFVNLEEHARYRELVAQLK